MATATSKMSFDLPPSLIEIPPLVNPHALPNHHVRPPDLVPAAHSQPRRVSSESQTPGRASPSPRVSRRTPVPFLLEAFPAPPSHIPGTPTSLTPGSLLASPSLLASTTSWLSSASPSSPASTNPTSPTSTNVMSPCSPKSVAATLPHSNPPPSSPPTVPLPPVPGPSTVTSDLFATHRALQTAARSASPAESYRSLSRSEQRRRLSTDSSESVRARGRQGSLSSLRNPVHLVAEQSETIAEDPAEGPCPAPPAGRLSPPLFGSVAERRSCDRTRVESPDILRPSLSRALATALLRSNEKCTEDSIASVDMSDLNALKSDNEGDGEDQDPLPFPRFPPLLGSQPQSPADPVPSAPSYVHTPRKLSRPTDDSDHVSSTSEDTTWRRGAMSPEITQMISATPRLSKRPSASRSRESISSRARQDSARSRRGDAPPVPTSSCVQATVKKAARPRGDDGGASGGESDSSLDLHTPLPQLMLRHGMLSPNSKLLPQHEQDPTRLSILSSSSYMSTASNLSLKSTASTSSRHPKDARDTLQRRVRHRDGKLLKGGIGLTTGLGWSDSEDEDAPSPLTRRVSTLVLSRRASSSSVASYRSARSASSVHPLSRSISHSILREADEDDADEFGYSNRSSLATTRSLPSRSMPVSRVASVRSAGSSLGRYSTHSMSSTGTRVRTGSASESSIYAASIASKPDNANPAEAQTGLMPGIREQDDGMTPTRAAFERASLGSTNGSVGADVPHTPSSTASSASLPFPATPESGEEITQPQLAYTKDKVLPPLPPGVRGKYPSTLSLRSQFSVLPRPRTPSASSSLSNKSNPGVPLGDTKSNTPSTTSTPRQSLAGRPANTAIPAAPRPSLGGTPRPSLTIPKSPFPSQSATSGLPRPTTPSLSPSANASQGYAPRPLRLVSRNSPLPPSVNASPLPSPNLAEVNHSPTDLQPGEQSPRAGQVLTYNRNVHDQLKLRALSLNTGPNRTQAPMVSPGGAQTLVMPPPSIAPGSNSPLSTPPTTRSQSPLPSPSGDGFRPRPRTGTGMLYRNNLSVGSATPSRIRVPSTVSR